MRPGVLVGIVLALVAGLSWWLARGTGESRRLSDGPQDNRPIDYYLRDLDFTTFSPQGAPARRLQSPELRHYADDDGTELDDPDFVIHRPEGPPWRVRSQTGWISPDGKQVLLQGEVLIERDAGEGVRPMRIESRKMRVEPDRDYAETDEAVTVTSLDDRIDSVGMQAWLGEPGRIKFLSHVRGHYAAPQ